MDYPEIEENHVGHPPLQYLTSLWLFDATINMANANGLMLRLRGLLPGQQVQTPC